jgi:hypothetical protein
MAHGIEHATKELFECGRPGYRKIVIIISDGAVDDKSATRIKSIHARNLGITIVGLTIQSIYSDPDFMREICDIYAESDYETLTENLRKMDVCL